MASQWTDQELEALRVLREYMTTKWRSREGDVSDVNVSIEGEPGAAEFAVTFKHRDRPGCVFGSHFAMGDVVDGPDDEPSATIVWANLDEDIDAVGYGLPTNCRPDEVIWLGKPLVFHELRAAIRQVLDGYAGQVRGDEVDLLNDLVEVTGKIAWQRELDERGRTERLQLALIAAEDRKRGQQDGPTPG